MREESTGSSRPSWRRPSGPPPRAERPRHAWTRRGARPETETSAPKSATYKVVAALLGFLACLAAVVILINLLWRPPSVALVLAGADYADNLLVPQNVLGWKGLEAIDELAKAGPPWSLFPHPRLVPVVPLSELSVPSDWDKLINVVKKSRFKEKTILIVLSLHGGSDSAGAYLLPDQMTGSEKERIDLRAVIKSMGELPEDKVKILVLEGAQVPSNWQLGMLHNDFARKLEGLEDEIRKVPHLWVLSAAGVDQRCWASEGLGRTVFCHYLAEALRGRAVEGDGLLSLEGLHGYLASNVGSWVWKARGAIQEPVLLPRARRRREGGGGKTAEPPSDKAGTTETASRRPASEVFLPTIARQSAAKSPGSSAAGPATAWKEYDELDSQVPHPAAYTPGAWARYKAELLRYDELLRAGASDQVANPVREMIGDSKLALDQGRFLKEELSSVENNLAMSALEGRAGPSEEPSSPFTDFWTARPGSDSDKQGKALLAANSDTVRGQASVRIRVDRFLLSQAIQASQDPGKNLKSVFDKLTVMRGGQYPRPAEAHFVRMLAQRLVPGGTKDEKRLLAVRQAISLRTEAERAALGVSRGAEDYSYCEQVYPWIRDRVKDADAERRPGEDQLFSSEESAWTRAAEALRRAHDLYARVDDRAAAVRKALETRDRTLARLPEISHWVADRGPDELISAVEKLWEKTHRLAEELEKADTPPELTDLTKLDGDVSGGMNQVTSRIDAVLAERLDVARDEPEDWEETTALAAIPWGETQGGHPIRERLRARLGDIAKFDREKAAMEPKTPIKFTEKECGPAEERVRARAIAHARMALAAVGKRWFDDAKDTPSGERADHASTVDSILALGKPGGDQGKDFLSIISEVGDRVGERWQRLAVEIDGLVHRRDRITDFRAAAKDLVKADRLERLLEGGSPRPEGADVRAAVPLREARVHDLLLGMAERAWEDHWYDEDSKGRYYQAVGNLFIKDAEKLIPDSLPVRDARELMKREKRITVEVRRQITFTSETKGNLEFFVKDKGTVPDGLPVVRPTVGPPLKLDPDSDGDRVVRPGRPGETAAVTVLNPLGDRFEKDPQKVLQGDRLPDWSSEFHLNGYFRGQKFGAPTEVSIHPVPDTVAIGPPPTDAADASIAVRASQEIIDRFGAGTGSIAIVLDCSDSMLAETVPGRTKFDEAQMALRAVLGSVPAGTRLSLWTFSQLPPGVQVVNKGDALDKEPELTIQPLLQMAPWDPRQTEAVIAQVAQLRPYLWTPLVTAMWEAASKDLAAARGLKTLLVLTDGEDTELRKFKPKYNPDRLSVRDFILRHFKPLHVTVNMVFFTPRAIQQQIRNARDAFQPALAQLEPPGSFKTAGDLNELIKTLKGGLIQKLTCQVLRPGGTPVDEEPLDVTNPKTKEVWCRELKPGNYTVRVHAGTVLERGVDLRGGDRIIIELVEDAAGGIAFQRGLYSDGSEFKGRRPEESGAWQSKLLANQLRQTGTQERFEFATSLERKPEGDPPGVIRQVGPGMAWFRLGADVEEHPEDRFVTRWRERAFYPGPVWHFDVPRWIPGPDADHPAMPILQAWWWSNPEGKPLPHLDVTFDAPGDPGKLPRDLPLDEGGVVTLESMLLEDHQVEVAPSNPQIQDCLVVRLAFPPGHRCLVDPDSLRRKGLKIVGYEHRLYSRAGKYTGLFWPVNLPAFKDLTGLGVLDLDRLEKQAEKAKNTIRMNFPKEQAQVPPPPEVPPRADH